MSDYVKHKGPWLPGMMVVDHGTSRRGRVWEFQESPSAVRRWPGHGTGDELVCRSPHSEVKWNVEVGPWLSADISDETTLRLIGSLRADATLPPILRPKMGGAS